jgi:hypothetical protein
LDRANWIQQIGQNRPELELKINGKIFKGLIDTGVDVSVISLTYWPASGPMQPAVTQLYGIGQSQSPYQSSSLFQQEELLCLGNNVLAPTSPVS